MREFNFRAWDSFNNRMIQNYRILKICFDGSDLVNLESKLQTEIIDEV